MTPTTKAATRATAKDIKILSHIGFLPAREAFFLPRVFRIFIHNDAATIQMWNHKIYDQKEYSVPFLILVTTVI